jgi:type III secretion protein L
MVIWLSRPRHADGGADTRFGVDSDIVSRETFGTLATIDNVYGRAEAERQAILAAAQVEREQILHAAQGEAAALVEAARRERESAAARGYEEGAARGQAEWLERILAIGADAHRLQRQMRARMAELVTLAVERIVRTEGSDALFARALDAIDRIVEGATHLRVLVHPDDHTAAQHAFSMLAARLQALGRPVALAVLPDARLAPGACLCESDLGIADAGLTTQLDAMRAAIERALHTSMKETDLQGEAAQAPL